MAKVFFIADTHFGHKNIIKFDSYKGCRKFDNIEQHDEALVENWNKTVSPKDTVWHLGDFCFGKVNLEIAARLNGTKKLVLGNHDLYQTADYLKYFHKVYGAVEYKGYLLTHIPVHENQLDRFGVNIHGHLHSKVLDDNRYFNVSVERIHLTPIDFEEIKELTK